MRGSWPYGVLGFIASDSLESSVIDVVGPWDCFPKSLEEEGAQTSKSSFQNTHRSDLASKKDYSFRALSDSGPCSTCLSADVPKATTPLENPVAAV